MGVACHRGNASGGFADQFQNTLERAQEVPVPIEIRAFPTTRESDRFARELQHVQE